MNDNYPTRKQPVEQLIPRREACIAGDGMTGYQQAKYILDGYIVLKQFFKSDSIQACAESATGEE